MKCEFSERNYEKSLDFELSVGNPFFSPNQLQEDVLGIDSSTLTDNADFWRLWDPNWLISPSVPQGVEISRNLWKWRRGISRIHHFPRMRANVFLQYKIPEYITSRNGSEYSDWNHPYFRYDIVTHQNNALRILERITGQSAIVVYASPAFWTYDQLIEHCNQRTLHLNSNFVKPSTLLNHNRYSYDTAGNFGIRHSEPSKIDKINLKNEINTLVKLSLDNENYVTLKKLSLDIDNTVEEIDRTKKEIDREFKRKFLKTKNYFLELNNVLEMKDALEDDSQYLLNILAFTFQTNLSWFIAS